ncbi:MAG: SMP-30/gluconolactonase/LRE family protein [Candidatus Latescibacteria bacterium]|nr:SMP-30/gluconolactonase/LRE family protein [Candidatus Latescibacterota bacterium]
MKLLLLLLALSVGPALAQTPPATVVGDPSVVALDARLEKLFGEGFYTEGPAVAPDGTVFFSDVTFTAKTGMQAGHIWRFDPVSRKTILFRSPSGMASGLKFDAQGRLLAAEGADYGGRRLTRTDLKTGKSEILAGRYEGRPLNSPKDLTLDAQGRIYFSDPRYLGQEPVEQPVMGVYRLNLDGSLHRIITDAGKPNGVCISPDQRTLYVVSSDNGTTGMDQVPAEQLHKGRMALLAYNLLPDGTAKFREVLIDYYPQDGPNGLVVDVEGNLYVAVRDATRPGIYVYSPRGQELSYIPTPELPTNVAFGRGAEIRTLYLTAGGSLYRLRVKKDGYQLPSF